MERQEREEKEMREKKEKEEEREKEREGERVSNRLKTARTSDVGVEEMVGEVKRQICTRITVLYLLLSNTLYFYRYRHYPPHVIGGDY